MIGCLKNTSKNMSKICLINQPAGLGDIFFLQKFVDLKIQEGFKVIFPVVDNLISASRYFRKESRIDSGGIEEGVGSNGNVDGALL